jgi:TIR domain/Pentapeptide repeats (8 copies)
MANPEHVEIVMRGVRAVADWRAENEFGGLDLAGARFDKRSMEGINLAQANLTDAVFLNISLKGANLANTDCSGARFELCDLESTTLGGAKLAGADVLRCFALDANLACTVLSNACLRGTDLSGASLAKADLRCTNFEQAWLFGTKFYGSDFIQSQFHGAKMSGAIFGDVDLSGAVGLEDVTHERGSTLGIDTLVRSKGKIPEAFIRGCGVPQSLIDYLPSLIGSMEPIQFYSCFISHSGKNEDFAKRLHARLVADKLRVWFAPEDMRGGVKSAEQIDQAIRIHDRLLLLLSDESMKSEWVRREIKHARKKEKETGKNVLFPVGLVPFEVIRDWECLDSDSGEDLAAIVRAYHIPDFSEWKHEDAFEKAFADLMRDLRREAERDEDKGDE